MTRLDFFRQSDPGLLHHLSLIFNMEYPVFRAETVRSGDMPVRLVREP